ncbi:MAG: glycosyltransferase family 39 protein [Armatimonadota bacterium]
MQAKINNHYPAKSVEFEDNKLTPRQTLFLWTGLITGFLMLLWFPLAKSIWTDEAISIAWGKSPFLDILLGRATSADALPLHPLLIHITHLLFGDSLAAFRVASALPSAISLYFVYLIGRRFSNKVGLLALWLCALSPGLILYDRMSRYHGLTALLCTMSVWAALKLADTGRLKDAVLYSVITWLMLMSYFLSVFALAAQVGCLLLFVNREPVKRVRWLFVGALCAAGLAFVPYLLAGLAKASSSGMADIHVEDASMSLGLAGFIRRLALPVYVFCVGETLYPWTWFASIPGVIAALTAYFVGFGHVIRSRRVEVMIPAVCLAVLLLSAIATSGKLGGGQTVGSMAKRVSFAIPLFCVTLSVGVYSLLGSFSLWRRRAGAVLGAVLVLVSCYSVFNYWTGQQFLNPNYTAPWNEAIGAMQKVQPLSNEVAVFSRGEYALAYYLASQGLDQKGAYIDTNTTDEKTMIKGLTSHPSRYVWIVGRDRGDRISVDAFMRMSDYLKSHYSQVGTYGVMPRSATESKYLEKFLKRPAAPHYIWMELYDTEQAPKTASVQGKLP